MSNFISFKKAVQKQITKMIKDGAPLFVAELDREVLWNQYLDAFPAGTNEIFRERREYDCACCKSFIKNIGNVVTIENNKLVSVWDNIVVPAPFDVVTKALSLFVKSNSIRDAFVTTDSKFGTDKNREDIDGKVKVWEHFYTELPKSYVSPRGTSVGAEMGKSKADKQTFLRAMSELTLESAEMVLDLIAQNSLYKGTEYKAIVNKFVLNKLAFDKVAGADRDNWAWLTSRKNPVSKIRNSAIGTLLINLSEDMDLDTAVGKFEHVVAPENYKRPKELFTKKMLAEAKEKLVTMGLINSLGRKFAVMSDITVNNVIWANRNAQKAMGGDIFDAMEASVPVNPKTLSKVEEMPMQDFIDNILPTATNVEVMVEGKHTNNFMSLVAPTDKDAPSILKWGNNFGWEYNGGVADSMKQRVKDAGGKVEGVLRGSIMWNENGGNSDDYDIYCEEPNGNKIWYSNARTVHRSSGMLDIDITNPGGTVAVENIIYTDKNKMPEGVYTFYNKNYSNRGGKNNDGFRSQIEFDGQIFDYDYPKGLRTNEKVIIAKVKYTKANGFEVIESLDGTTTSKEIWGVTTNQFVPVSNLMYSPNFWDGQEGIGNKHFFFLLEGCKNADTPRGFYNEFLHNDLMEHKRVFAAMGSKMRVPASDDQLSGLGFSSTQKNDVIVKVEGKFTRTLRLTV